MEALKAVGGIVAGLVVVALLCVGIWAGYWWLAGSSQTHRYQVNTQSQQYQGGLVSQERDRIAAFDQLGPAIAGTSDPAIKAADQQQRQQIKTTFCEVYANLNPAPIDVSQAYGRICQ